MSGSVASLRKKIDGAGDLQSVVHTMKALAASSIGQYERSVRALADYCRTVELGLGACFRDSRNTARVVTDDSQQENTVLGAVVFGSDQGLVGQFNEVIADYAVTSLAALTGRPRVWAVGERVQSRLTDAGLILAGVFSVPGSVQAISPLVGQILTEAETVRGRGRVTELHLFYNRPTATAGCSPTDQRLLPLDEEWRRALADVPWPTRNPPEVIGGTSSTLRALIREHLFISLFRACAESLASENGSRLAAMERAETNIKDLLTDLQSESHRLRQSSIDEELFDVVSGFEALAEPVGRRP